MSKAWEKQVVTGRSSRYGFIRRAIMSGASGQPHIPAHVASAVLKEKRGRPREALKSLDEALRVDPKEGWIYSYRSRLRFQLGDVPGFVADCEAAIFLDEAPGYFDAALGKRRLTIPGKARAADRYLAAHPDAYWMYVYRGACRRSPELNEFGAALADFEKAVSLRPDCSWAWAYLARARKGLPALEAISRAIALKPDCGWFYIWRGEIRRRLGDLSGSLADLDRGLSLDPNYEYGYAWRGGVKRLLGRPAEAVPDLDLAARLDPQYAWTFHERCLAFRALGKTRKALEDLDRACRLDPKFVWCAKPEAAAAALADLEKMPKPRSASFYAWRGNVKMLTQNFPGARADFDRALTLDPGHARARAWRGFVLLQSGRANQARRDLDSSIRLDRSFANAFAWRGLLRRDGGDWRGALADLQKASKLDRISSKILAWKGEVQLLLRRRKRALADVNSSLELDRNNSHALALRARLLR